MTNDKRRFMPINAGDLTNRIWLEVTRLEWSRAEVRACLTEKFNKRAVILLDDSELMQFMLYLSGKSPTEGSK